jgi:hypothetical protein
LRNKKKGKIIYFYFFSDLRLEHQNSDRNSVTQQKMNDTRRDMTSCNTCRRCHRSDVAPRSCIVMTSWNSGPNSGALENFGELVWRTLKVKSNGRCFWLRLPEDKQGSTQLEICDHKLHTNGTDSEAPKASITMPQIFPGFFEGTKS